MAQSPITLHVLDTSLGKPAAGLKVALERSTSQGWKLLAHGITDDDGRCSQLLPPEAKVEPGVYRIIYETGAYFTAQTLKGFYPHVTVEFEIVASASHYHVPLLLSPFGYTTYRGS